jgi:hypothetical protein
MRIEKLLAIFVIFLAVSAFGPAFQRQVYDWVIVKKLTVQEGGASFSSNLDMDANLIQNIGNSGTDFASNGGLTLANSLTVSTGGATVTDGGLTLSDDDLVVADDLRVSAQTAITVTDGGVLTATGTYQPIQAAGEVTPTLETSTASAGDVLTIINTSNQTINLADSGTAKLSAAFAMGQYDSLALWFDGTNWIEISRSNN